MPLTTDAAPGPIVVWQAPGRPEISACAIAAIAPAVSVAVNTNGRPRRPAASISSRLLPPPGTPKSAVTPASRSFVTMRSAIEATARRSYSAPQSYQSGNGSYRAAHRRLRSVTMTTFGRSMLEHWMLDPDCIYLNHGTVGAAPRRVLRKQQALRDEIERQPSRFMLRELGLHHPAPWRSVSRLREAS